jgi:hypothetical protein
MASLRIINNNYFCIVLSTPQSHRGQARSGARQLTTPSTAEVESSAFLTHHAAGGRICTGRKIKRRIMEGFGLRNDRG